MNAYLLLANGMVFAGQSLGCPGTTLGEVIFSTGVVGFQEGLTDPASYGALVAQTYPMVGNYGMNDEDKESDSVWANGIIVREACHTPSNFRCQYTFEDFLKANGTIGICGVDTRHLTRILRESGSMNGAITTEFDPADPANADRRAALMAEIEGFTAADGVKTVTCKQASVYNPEGDTHVVLVDYGTKRNTVRCLTKRGSKVTVVPAYTTAAEISALNPDGILLSAGPGDASDVPEIVANAKEILDLGKPVFGIGLGHLVAAAAAGVPTVKMKHGHHGANQPVTDLAGGRTYITAQGHGYAVDSEKLPAEVGTVAQINANDGSCEGIQYKCWNCFTVQFNPEANGGPKETEFLFDRFLDQVKNAKEAQ